MLDQKLIRENPTFVEDNLSLRGKVYNIAFIHNLTVERKEIEIEMTKTQKDIFDLKKNSIKSINSISKEIAANIIEKIVGDKLNESSIQASIDEVSKKNLGKYL